MSMELTFTDWEHYTDSDGTARVLDWSSPVAMRGQPVYPFLEALRQAMAERVAAIDWMGLRPAPGGPPFSLSEYLEDHYLNVSAIPTTPHTLRLWYGIVEAIRASFTDTILLLGFGLLWAVPKQSLLTLDNAISAISANSDTGELRVWPIETLIYSWPPEDFLTDAGVVDSFFSPTAGCPLWGSIPHAEYAYYLKLILQQTLRFYNVFVPAYLPGEAPAGLSCQRIECTHAGKIRQAWGAPGQANIGDVGYPDWQAAEVAFGAASWTDVDYPIGTPAIWGNLYGCLGYGKAEISSSGGRYSWLLTVHHREYTWFLNPPYSASIELGVCINYGDPQFSSHDVPQLEWTGEFPGLDHTSHYAKLATFSGRPVSYSVSTPSGAVAPEYVAGPHPLGSYNAWYCQFPVILADFGVPGGFTFQ